MKKRQKVNGRKQTGKSARDERHTVYLSLGSNLGNKAENIDNAIEKIAEKAGTVSAISSVYETKPWGYESDNDFFNLAIRIETSLSPIQLLKITQEIEKEMGRTEKSSGTGYQDRIIDIDLILYDNLVLNTPELTLPHPHFHERKFVLDPLKEINPHLAEQPDNTKSDLLHK
ncbi:MAG: 2-amino-4-hydroxy-6-hydroxymethyldihydropteridine diphosphokinase [Dysgonamonadaceae bacterium]|jgi:2-amino-4-hydroxy-6-hydroxymethyldihydropteridine diphosphokinase|nr:2-amino-4-hydroxy-6-hydroxymethyldihydropteridine diphosphokinase [Dysgonamonadaceae bacterium]